MPIKFKNFHVWTLNYTKELVSWKEKDKQINSLLKRFFQTDKTVNHKSTILKYLLLDNTKI